MCLCVWGGGEGLFVFFLVLVFLFVFVCFFSSYVIIVLMLNNLFMYSVRLCLITLY